MSPTTGSNSTEGGTLVFEFPLEDGRTIRISHLALTGGGYVATHEDVTSAVRAETRIRHMARYDALTNLPNRVHFREKLLESLKAVSSDNRAAVLLPRPRSFQGGQRLARAIP